MKIENEFLIPFIGLKLGKHPFEFQINNKFFERFDYHEYENSDIKVDVVLDKKSTHLEISFKHKGTITVPCDLATEIFDLARQFLERYESSEVAVGKPERWWFAPRPALSAGSDHRDAEATRHLSMAQHGEVDGDLSRLVLDAFTAYVPRKLVRLVELLHQVQEVASRRGRTLSVGGTGGTDVRVVTALVMIQLFQPDLYRLVRRKPQAFPLLLAAFATRENGQPQIADPAISDLDLWLWVVDESADEDNDWLQKAEPTKVQDAVVTQIAKIFRGREKEVLSGNVTVFDLPATYAERFRAQNVKLPLVAQIVEHRATHRHAFDPLRLFHALAGALETGWKHPAPAAQPPATVSPAADVSISAYFELMVARDGADGAARERVRGTFSTSWSVDTPIATQPVRYPDRLFADLTSADAGQAADHRHRHLREAALYLG